MPGSDALSWLRTHGNQRRLCTFVEAVTGRKQDAATVSGWATGKHAMAPTTEALVLLLIAHPELLDEGA